MDTTQTGSYYPLYNETTIGTCSICSGPVTVPTIWHGVIPPTPTCRKCGAIKAADYGPVIKMEPRRWGTVTTTEITWDSNGSNGTGSTVHW